MGKLMLKEEVPTPSRKIMTTETFRALRKQLKDQTRMGVEEITRPIGSMSTYDQREPAVRALGQVLEAAPDRSVQIDEMNINPVSEPPGFGDVALALFNLDKDLISKTRLPRRVRALYTRAIVVGRHFGLLSILNYVWMDLTLMIPEDGKRVKEFLIPFENLLRDRARQLANQPRSGEI